MKKIVLVMSVFMLVLACKNDKKAPKVASVSVSYASFGEKINADASISKEEMMAEFKTMKAGDTLNVKFSSKVNSVCKAKGCWMKLDLGNEKESFVKFKDYSFFVPLNSDDRNVIVNGKAYVTEVSVAEQQHFAKDAGKTDEEIALITVPKFTYSIMADGVLMEEEVSNE